MSIFPLGNVVLHNLAFFKSSIFILDPVRFELSRIAPSRIAPEKSEFLKIELERFALVKSQFKNLELSIFILFKLEFINFDPSNFEDDTLLSDISEFSKFEIF